MRWITRAGFDRLVRALGEDYDVYAPDAEGATLRRLSFDPEREETPVPFPAARMPRPLKPLWIPSAKIVSRWTPKGPADGPAARPRAVVGAKACDLAALDILDRVLRDAAYTEPTWCAARDQNLVVSGDCTACRDSCFCTTLGGKPWATEGFDLNLAPSGEGYLVEPGSERGEALLARHADFLREASAAEVERRDDLRREVEASVRRQNAAWPVHDPFDVSVEKNLKTRIWGKLAARCVECNACNTVCPTCHCFLLFDRPTEEGSARVSQWDSCFHAGYARMAGGGTPRLQLTERFKNHYYHKFVSFPRNWGVTACTGCGRCVDACMGRIDKRECLHRLEAEWMPSEVLSEIE